MNALNFFLDIDGTIVSEGTNEVLPSVIDAVKKAKPYGHRFFINTARPQWLVPDTVFSPEVFDGILCGCGSFIKYRGDTVYQSFISDAELKALYKEIEGYGIPGYSSIIESFGTTYYHGDERPEYSVIGYKKLGKADDIGEKVKDIRAQKFSLYKKAEELPSALLSSLKEKYNVMEHPTYVEIAQKGFSKAAAIRLIERKLSIPHESTVAMGDSSNDIEMLKYAAISVAMGNATDKVKTSATTVTDTCENGGVAKAIMKLTGIK